MDNTSLIAKFNETLNEILSYDLERDLIRSDDLGKSASFVELRPAFLRTIATILKIKDSNLQALTASQLKRIYKHLRDIVESFDSIKKFNSGVSSPQIRTDILNSFETNFDALIEKAVPILSVSIYKRRF